VDKAGSTTRPGGAASGADVVAGDGPATGPMPVTPDPAAAASSTTIKPGAKPGKPATTKPAAASTSSTTTSKPAPAKPAPVTPAPAKPAPTKPVAAPSAAAPVAAAAAATAATVTPGAPTSVTPTLPPLAAEQRQPVAATRPVGPRRARLLLTRLDPWSVMKTAFMLSVSLAVVVLVAVALLWWTLSVTGVFDAIGRTIDDVAGSTTSSFDFLSLVGFSRVMGVALVLAAIEIVLVSALSTLFAFLYNLSVGLTGGLEVTLSEDS
jgi:hypothetical protein